MSPLIRVVGAISLVLVLATLGVIVGFVWPQSGGMEVYWRAAMVGAAIGAVVAVVVLLVIHLRGSRRGD